jgi:ATP/ADP translocase
MRDREASIPENLRNRGVKRHFQQRWLRWLNLRPEESERTFLMFVFYTLSSVGILWLEVSVAALFLGEYGARSLPLIYIASAGIGTGIGIIYSWMQRFLPLQRVLVLTAVLMAMPLLLFRVGMHPAVMGGYIVFLMRLWLEAIYVINELNTSITANQLFTIREIKRTYPLISSGILAADVLSGLSLPILREWVGLPNVILLACIMLLLGACTLLYLTRTYRAFFPDASRRRLEKEEQTFLPKRLRGTQRQYVILVFAFFCLVQVLALLLDFQYLSQLEQGFSVENIADFLALFSAILGVFELVTQWFVSGRAIERLGVFTIAALPPLLLAGLSAFTLVGVVSVFAGVIGLKFIDELLRYTLVASTAPILFQPIPTVHRNRIQSMVRGIAEPISTGLTGAALLGTFWLQQQIGGADEIEYPQSSMFLAYTAVFALLWLLAVFRLRSKYLEVLILGNDRGQLSLSRVDVAALWRNLLDTLHRATSDEEKASCIDLLTEVEPRRLGEALAPLLPTLSPSLQRQGLEAMLKFPDPVYLQQVRSLLDQPLPPDVLAKTLRYIWQTDLAPEHQQLQPYLLPEVVPEVRGTAAALLLRWGNPQQKAQATNLLRRMLTSTQERERLMGCRALSDAVYLQSLRLYIDSLLQDQSLRVRCAMLDVIAATRLEEYYSSLLKGLSYKSTRDAARLALIRLGNEAIPLLVEFAEDGSKPESIRAQAWMTLGQIASPDAIDRLVSRLSTAWGATRRTLLRVLLRVPKEAGVEAVLEHLGRRGIEALIHQELQFLAHLYASLLDLLELRLKQTVDEAYPEADLLQSALRNAEEDAIERLFLLLRFLYDSNKIQAAAFSLQSESRESVARGLEILDNTIDLASKSIILQLLDRQPDAEKLRSLFEIVPYAPLPPYQRLRSLLNLRHFLPDWLLACCFHLARRMQWSLSTEQILICLHSPTGFVREAVLSYLSAVVSQNTLQQVLPRFRNDPDRLVASQVEQILTELKS